MDNSPTTFDGLCALHIPRAESGDRFAASGPVTFSLPRDSIGIGQSSITFHELYSRYASDVYRFAHWLSGNSHDAHDITAETFVRAWTAPEEPRLESVKAYLFAIARNLHRKQWRRASRHEALDEAMPDPATRPDEAAVNRDEFERTLAAVHALPEMDRTVLLLRAEEDLSYQDIAAVTGLSVTAAKVRVFRARAKLSALLQPETKEKL
jgi:RNA polymerase sigma-70 factor (ECF subfamily)